MTRSVERLERRDERAEMRGGNYRDAGDRVPLTRVSIDFALIESGVP